MFIEIPANKKSLSFRKSVHGIGVNDAKYQVRPKINKKHLMCPYYKVWDNMLERCYSGKFHKLQPTYKECSVSSEWLVFSNFKRWMVMQEWKGRELDKDILIQGNKTYSADTCIFVSHKINMLLRRRTKNRDLPLGVCWHKQNKKYHAQCRSDGETINIGFFDTPKAASEAYIKFKYEVIKNIASTQTEPLKSALLNYTIEL